MKRFIVGFGSYAALIASAFASEIALKAPPPATVPVISWTGFYIGGNAGGGWATTDWQGNYNSHCSPGFIPTTCDISQSSSSFVGGGQIGGRWQTGKFVLGIEASADYARFRSHTENPFSPATSVVFRETKLDKLYTVTGQAGFTWDRSLWYVKGGWATSSLTRGLNVNLVPAAATPNTAYFSNTASGWTVGAGFEYRLPSMPNFSIGLEYDFIHLTADNATSCYAGAIRTIFNCPNPANPLRFAGFAADISQVLFRANYTFGPSAPIVAKY